MAISTKSGTRISATEARVHFGEIYRRVTENDETIVIERNGKAGAVILSMEEFEALRARGRDGEQRPAWFENAIRIGQELATQRAGKPPIDWVEVIREGREERDAALLDVLLRRESGGDVQ